MPETLKRLKRAFKDKGQEVVTVDDPEQEADFVVIVGEKTDGARSRGADAQPGRDAPRPGH